MRRYKILLAPLRNPIGGGPSPTVILDRLVYRLKQFWHFAIAPGRPCLPEQVSPYLSPTQTILFLRQSVGEQRHALTVIQRLRATNQHHPDLMAAALLHDVGKILYPLSVWERALAVLGQRFARGKWFEWANGAARGWRKAFVVAAQHAEWGAYLAAEANASPLTVDLIRYHHTPPTQAPAYLVPFLSALQAADDNS